eukprot:5982966-Amphidinium_carterae.2
MIHQSSRLQDSSSGSSSVLLQCFCSSDTRFASRDCGYTEAPPPHAGPMDHGTYIESRSKE